MKTTQFYVLTNKIILFYCFVFGILQNSEYYFRHDLKILTENDS